MSGLAKLCRCSSSLLSQMETGAINPSLSTLKAVSDALNISMASLFEEASTRSQAPFSLMKAGERKAVATRGG
ncbi:MAG: helix-turn-helix domain-containing protein, partial [Desulfobacterales bacterium]|nr:helix-turn-helix domain-containing protein [Desulfobacterales bacterium]